MTGDLAGTAGDDSAPAAQQLCVIPCQAAPVAGDWTQKGDGLLVADASGGVTMYRVTCQLSSQPLASTQSGVYPGRSVPANFAQCRIFKPCKHETNLHAYMQGCGTCEASSQAPWEQSWSSYGRPLLRSHSRCYQAGKVQPRPLPLLLWDPRR